MNLINLWINKMSKDNLPHALILELPEGFDDLKEIIDPFKNKQNYILEINEHKSPSSTTIGIFIEDIRLLRDTVKTQRKGVQTIVIIHDAAKLTEQAQNALLKILEEPHQNSHFILATKHIQSLLDTVRSRCQVKKIAPSNLTIDLPADKKARIKFMSDGDKFLESRLIKDSEFYNKKVKVFESAKIFISGSQLDKMALITSIKESRDEALDLVNASLTVCKFMITSHYNNDLRMKTDKLLQTGESLRKNANIRLALLACVI